jgi:(p)ppGpp synthase/HD superfamily hydrolase
MFPDALAAATGYAARAHADQIRKRGPGDDRPGIPYVSHLLGVAGLVLEDGGSTEEVVAGLLHDVLEDQDPFHVRAAEIEHHFGLDVRLLVEACSGPKEHDPGMAEYRTRKQVYLDHLAVQHSTGAIRVSLADKVHNARCTVNDLEADGPDVWDRFNAGFGDQLWWYRGLVAIFATHSDAGRARTARVGELRRLVARMAEFGP